MFGFGFLSISKMRKEAFPEVTLGRFIITSIYPGASAGDIEVNVTLPIEDALKKVEGIQEVKSFSRESVSIVDIVADENMEKTGLQKLYLDIDSAVSGINNFPTGLKGKPVIQEITSSNLPILEIAFTGEYNDLKNFIPEVKDSITLIEGVSSVTSIGLGDEEVHILVDPELAKKEFTDLISIAGLIKRRNLHGSGGTLESFLDEKKIVSYDKFEKPEDILETYVRMSPDGFGVKLKQVAKLEYHPEDLKLKVLNNGKKGVSLHIIKKANADILKTIDRVSVYLEKLKLPNGVTFQKMNDGSRLTRNRLSLVIGNAMMGFVLVVIILLLVFDLKTAIWTAFGIPFSLLGCIVILQLNGLTMNMFILGGFILVVGMLVDDAIVIAETVNSNLESGMNPVEASSSAVSEVWSPVLASSATTMIAFLPMVSLGGLPGKFIWMIPLVVILSLGISIFESYFLLPSHLAHGRKKVGVTRKGYIIKLENSYRSILKKVIHQKILFLLFILALFIASIVIVKNFIKKEPFPQEGSEGFIINLLLHKGSSLEKTESVVSKIDSILNKLPKEELDGYSARIGTNSESVTTELGSLSNSAVIFVYLKPYEKRKRIAEEIRESVKLELDKEIKKDVDSFATKIVRFGPPLGRAFEVRVIANDPLIRKEKAEEVKKFSASITGVYDVEDDEIEGKDELNLKINQDLLSRAGLTVEDVLQTLRIAYEGIIVTDIVNMDRKIDFRLRLNKKARADIHFIHALPIMNRTGQAINLKNILSVNEAISSDEFRHINGKRYTSVFGNLNKEIITPGAVVEKIKEKFQSSDLVNYEYAGEPVENEKIFKNLAVAAIFALLGIYLIIALIFNSYIKPLIVILAIPFALIGVILALFAHGMAFSMFVGIALIGLMGVIVNNSIVMVFTTSERAGDAVLTEEIIIEGAVQRLRPILLTTSTTILGLLPTAYGIGGHDPVLSPMSLALSYGLLFGTVIVLYFIPVVYSIGLKFQKK
jgi:multidrug efflux pump subunit AcrB